MKSSSSFVESKFKVPIYPFINNNNKPPLMNLKNKIKELQIKTRNNSNKKILHKSNSFSGKCMTENNDKEILYQKNIQLKTELNKIRKELTKIKSDNLKKDNEINKKVNLINSVYEIKENQFNFNIDEESKIEKENQVYDKCLHSNLIYKLKKQYIQLKKEMEKKDNDISLLKKNIKNSRINELILENTSLFNEFNQLKNSYGQLIHKNNNLYIKTKNFNDVENDYSKQHFIILKLQDSLEKITEENSNLKNENASFKTKIQTLNNENKKVNKKIIELEEQIKILSQEKKELEDKNYILNSQMSIPFPNLNNEKLSSHNSNNSSNGIKNAQITEITYILIKNFEAKKITKEDALNKIFKEILDNLNGENQVEKSSLVNDFTIKICDLINCNNEIDKSKISYLIEILLSSSNNELGKFMENFLQLIDSIKYYDLNDEKRLNEKIRNSLIQYKDYFIQNYKKDYISFFSFRALLNKKNIILDDESVEYLIYRMKKDCKTNNNTNQSIFDLCFKTVNNILNNIDESDIQNDEKNKNEHKENQINNDINNNNLINNKSKQNNYNNNNTNKPMENNYINSLIQDNFNQNEIITEENIKEDNLNKNTNLNENISNITNENFIIEENTNEIQEINSPKTEMQEIQNENEKEKSNDDKSDILQVSVEKIEDDI
jgi:hypothetical protein